MIQIDSIHASNLRVAIKDKVTVSFPYQGRSRVVCPYLLGKTKDDRYVLHALQIGGESSKGPVQQPEWRFFYLDEMTDGPDWVGKSAWVQALTKNEPGKPYVPPKFITEVIEVHPKQEQ